MSETNAAIFHLSFHVNDLTASRHFYSCLLDCREGRSADTWIDFDFFGHQLSLHQGIPQVPTNTGQVDGVMVPMPHFGAVLTHTQWQQAADKLAAAKAPFIVHPQVRYAGAHGEQRTLFVLDPSGYAIELKSMANTHALFGK